jgi:hypothetical protein
MGNENNNVEKEQLKTNQDGINQWNDRLDENLEPEKTGDVDADEKAKEYSDQQGSGDQSDAADS